jgi:hypothetical protein
VVPDSLECSATCVPSYECSRHTNTQVYRLPRSTFHGTLVYTDPYHIISMASNSNLDLLELPLHPTNWGSEPDTCAEFEKWMIDTSTQLKAWLRKTRDQAQHDIKIASVIEAHNNEVRQEWAIHERNTDVQTGGIENRKQNLTMTQHMKDLKIKGGKLHAQHQTWRGHVMRVYADMAWEDFLYYQNVWNRRHFDSSKSYFETKKEQAEMEAKRQADPKQGSDHDEGVKGQSATTSSVKAEEADAALARLYYPWLSNVMFVYKKFRLAYRKEIPTVVAPANSHRYSQPTRGTTNQKQKLYQTRHEHLELRFPRRKRKRSAGLIEEDDIEDREVEEDLPSSDSIETIRRHQSGDQMEDIVWQLDPKAVKELKTRAEEEALVKLHAKEGYWGWYTVTNQGVEYAQETRSLLPDGHEVYHSSLATSFDWPTSFDPLGSANQIALTLDKMEYLYESDSNLRHLSTKDKKERRDDSGKTRKVEPKARYNTLSIVDLDKHVRVFEPELDGYGNVKGRDRDGNWLGEMVKKNVQRMQLESGRRRKPLPPKFMFKRRFQVHLKTHKQLKVTRQERHENKGRVDELSDAEDGDRTKVNRNFKWSGPDNRGQVPSGPGDSNDEKGGHDNNEIDGNMDGNGEENTRTGGNPGDEDNESEDEGDLFRQSYQECSGRAECPTRRSAVDIFARLQTEIGIVPSRSVESVIAWLKHGWKEAEIEAEYLNLFELYQEGLEE